MAATRPSESEVREALRAVIDPELGINVVDLGLVYRIAVEGERLEVDLAMTSAACPMGDYLCEEAAQALGDAWPAAEVSVQLVSEPPWSPERMSDEARRLFG